MLKWYESRKGYTLTTDKDVRVTVFFNKSASWSTVIDVVFQHGFRSVFQALDHAENAGGFKADRSEVQDCPPDQRPGRQSPFQRAAQGWAGPLEDPTGEKMRQAAQAHMERHERQQFAQAEAQRQMAGEYARREERMKQEHQKSRERMERARRHQDSAQRQAEQARRFAETWREAFMSQGGRFRGNQAPSWVAVLELPPKGPYVLKDIRAQYVKLVKKYHPDTGEGDPKMFQKVQEAWEAAQAAAR